MAHHVILGIERSIAPTCWLCAEYLRLSGASGMALSCGYLFLSSVKLSPSPAMTTSALSLIYLSMRGMHLVACPSPQFIGAISIFIMIRILYALVVVVVGRLGS